MDETTRLASEYRNAGISVIPLKLDGSKSPALPSWQPYRKQFATDAELCEWFSRPRGIGLVCGILSGGLEVIDFDDGSLFEPWRRQVKAIVERLPVVETPSGGWHVFFRCCEVGGNIKIAMDPTRDKQTMIETRGEGGYVVAEGSSLATHATGLPYVQYSGPALPNMPTITPLERRALWHAARSFDRRSEIEQQKLREKRQATPIPTLTSSPVHPVVQDFNSRKTWESILLPYGWTSNDGTHWTRPGKRFGTSAKVVIANDGNEILTIFSGNSGPLSPSGSFRKINKFDAWALLAFNGDNRTAFNAAKQEVAHVGK